MDRPQRCPQPRSVCPVWRSSLQLILSRSGDELDLLAGSEYLMPNHHAFGQHAQQQLCQCRVEDARVVNDWRAVDANQDELGTPRRLGQSEGVRDQRPFSRGVRDTGDLPPARAHETLTLVAQVLQLVIAFIAEVHELDVRLATEAGLDGDEARAVLEGDAYTDAVRADERRAQMLGIHGVPFFVVDERYGVSGAQPTELLLQVLEEAWAESHRLLKVTRLSTGADADL